MSTRSLSVDNVYELASMLLLGESDIDSLVDGAPRRADPHGQPPDPRVL
jgi:hypothetical protein